MSQVSSESDLDLDIDLESGGTSEEDVSKNQAFGCVNSKKLLGRVRSGLIRSKSLSECTSDGDCSCSYDEFMTSDDIPAKNKEQLGRLAQFGHLKIDEEKPKKHNSTKPSKPPRPPRGPSMDASDMKLLKEITELKSKRRRMERGRTSKKTKKEKASSLKTNLLACLVTVVFLLVIIFEVLRLFVTASVAFLRFALQIFIRCSGFTNVMPISDTSPTFQHHLSCISSHKKLE